MPSSAAVVSEAVCTGRSPFREGLKRFFRNRLAIIGLVLVIIEVVFAVFASVLTPYEPNVMDYKALLQGPSAQHVLGTDELGRDILTRMMHGAQLSLIVGISAVLIAVCIGV
ncbi:MAG: ABC transporter permease, partial [Planctomycetaceae bacterium]|nr:ABC transporter permease [Planctomycetaceae bacterium]